MNRYLLAGSAVVALALGTGSAFAQSKFEVRIGGDAVFEAAAVSQDRDANRRSVVFADRFRLNTVATGKADNGLSYGARLRLRSVAGTGGSNTVDADRAYIFVSGGFGQVRLGTTDTYEDDIISGNAGSAPLGWQTSVLNLVDEGVLHTTGGNGTAVSRSLAKNTIGDALNAGGKNASKIVYYSPKFSGFQVGASYAPNTTSSGYNVVRADNSNDAYHDVWEIGLSYAGEFSGVGIKALADYIGGTRNDKGLTFSSQREDLRAWEGNLQISYAGFAIGGGYINQFDSGLLKSVSNQKDLEIWTVGAQYTAGPVTFGGAYTHGQGNVGTRATTTATVGGVTSYLGKNEQEIWALGALYTAAPGLLFGAEYNYVKADAPEIIGSTTTDDKANVFMLRSVVIF
jgi:outer membrane protein OmpU